MSAAARISEPRRGGGGGRGYSRDATIHLLLLPELDAAEPQAGAQRNGEHARDAAGEQRRLPQVRRHLYARRSSRVHHGLTCVHV
eukprot:scaffold82583_cov60-Phaeocystis_antarctica.AAC.5